MTKAAGGCTTGWALTAGAQGDLHSVRHLVDAVLHLLARSIVEDDVLGISTHHLRARMGRGTASGPSRRTWGLVACGGGSGLGGGWNTGVGHAPAMLIAVVAYW